MENKYPKLSLQDLTKGVNLSAKEILEYEEIIDKLNKIAEENPEYIDHLRERYPKNDPRLSQIRYKLDGMLSASDEYIDTHFPENQKLFKKLQQSIKRNIKLTDPKNFKNTTKVITFFKLNSIEYVTKNASEIKKRIYLPKNKNKSVARFFKKEKQKNKIEEKLKILNKELKKTGMSWVFILIDLLLRLYYTK